MYLVAQQLVQPGVQVGVVALELPAEMLFVISVGPPAGHPFPEGEHLGVAKGDGRVMPRQGADVQKHLLRCLLLSELDVAPLGDEFFGLHFSCSGRLNCDSCD